MAEQKKNNWLLTITILFVAVALIFFPYNILDGKGILGFILNTNEYDKLGQFISGITSPIAIILLYLTYTSQKEELKASKNILEKQNKTLEKQQFESKLFSLIDIYNEIMKSFSKEDSGKTFFAKIKEELHKDYESYAQPEYSEHAQYPSGARDYKTYYFNHKDNLAHYFRVLYRIFKFIDDYPTDILDEKEKWFYTKTVRSQLSEGELFILFYNAFSDYGENFKDLIERYNLLKHLPLTDKLEVEKFYRKDFRAKKEIFKSIPGHQVGDPFPNYNEPIPVESMKKLLRTLDSIIDEALGSNEEVAQSVLFDNFLFYNVFAHYQNNTLTIKLVTDVDGQMAGLFYNLFKLKHIGNTALDLKEFLKEILYIRVVHDTFCSFQNYGNVELKGDIVFNKRATDDTLKGENYVWASIKRKDNESIRIITDKF